MSADTLVRPLRLTAGHARTFGSTGPYAPDALVLEYLGDLLRPFGLPVREDRYAAGHRNTFTGMADVVLRELDLAVPVDLVILAHELPDSDPRSCAAGYLSLVCPGEPLVFAVSDQGTVAPFTALRLARQYAEQDNYRRILIMVLDQSTLPYDDPAVEQAGLVDDHVVALLLDRNTNETPGTLCTGQYTTCGVAPEQLAGALADGMAALHPPADWPGITVVAGRGVPAGALPDELERRRPPLPPGRWCTGVWSALLTVLASPTGEGPVVVAEYDPAGGYLCLLGVHR